MDVAVPVGAVLDLAALELLDEVQRSKPASAKGRYIKKISLSPTMGPSVRIDANRLKAQVDSEGRVVPLGQET